MISYSIEATKEKVRQEREVHFSAWKKEVDNCMRKLSVPANAETDARARYLFDSLSGITPHQVVEEARINIE